jgi:hypothetical protein
MSKPVKLYYLYYKDDFGFKYEAFSEENEYGDWVRSDDYDTLSTQYEVLLAQAHQLQRALVNARHSDICPGLFQWLHLRKCICGLDAALAITLPPMEDK